MAFTVCQELVYANWRMMALKTQFVTITAETEGRMVILGGVVSNFLQKHVLFGRDGKTYKCASNACVNS